MNDEKILKLWCDTPQPTDKKKVLTFAHAIRDAALEEAAVKCENLGCSIHGMGREDSEAFDCADDIRSMKGKP